MMTKWITPYKPQYDYMFDLARMAWTLYLWETVNAIYFGYALSYIKYTVSLETWLVHIVVIMFKVVDQ